LFLRKTHFSPKIGENRDHNIDPRALVSSRCSSARSPHAAVTHLLHDATYTIKIRACHKPLANGYKRCSEFKNDEVRFRKHFFRA
jgi:hypothetical protein